MLPPLPQVLLSTSGGLPPEGRPSPRPGDFFTASYTNAAGTRPFKAFIPSGYRGQALPLIVMLHGCTQNPDDFANGTRMNTVADENQCFVVYPSQVKTANRSLCWNWFSRDHQHPGEGEPFIIAGITRQMIARYHIDPQRVFIAGMSAGGAMAVIVAASYPELFKALGVHSGMPYKAAGNLFYALAAMKYGMAKLLPMATQTLPIIVFHGDKDRKVHPHNGAQIVSQLLAARPAAIAAHSPIAETLEAGGRDFTRLSFRTAEGGRVAEHWVVHGAGHAWSGGNARGSHTDSKGPDATREMVRFFLGDGGVAPAGREPVPGGVVKRCLNTLKMIKSKNA